MWGQTASPAIAENNLFGDMSQTFLSICVAAIVIYVEATRHGHGGNTRGPARVGSGLAENRPKLLRKLVPELVGLVAFLTTAAMLRSRGDISGDDSEDWLEIKKEWPVLMCADTILALQCMLRLLVLVCTVLRGSTGPLPLVGECSVLGFLASLTRMVLHLRCVSYRLDGPLGGHIPMLIEVVSAVMLAVLGRDGAKRSWYSMVATAAGAWWLSSGHYLDLDDDKLSDKLFIAAHCIDTFAAFTYLFRALLADRPCNPNDRIAAGFAHMLMPVQQAMAAYFFVHAFDVSDSIIGRGAPGQLLMGATVLQLVAYTTATLLWAADCEDPADARQAANGALSVTL